MRIQTLFIVMVLLCCMGMPLAINASNISTTEKYAWSETGGWSNLVPTGGGVSVYPDHLEGFAWHENLGWIKLGSFSGGGTHTYANNATPGDWGVNLSTGTLSGYAWSENAGWVNFKPAGGGITINTGTGVFSGYAWAENAGWIHFDNITPAYRVVLLNSSLSVHITGYGTAAGTSAFGQNFNCSTVSGDFSSPNFSANALCPGTFINGDQLTLHGDPATDFSAPAWSGDCSIQGVNCVADMSSDRTIVGSFGTASKVLLLDPASKFIKGYATPAAAYTGATGTQSSSVVIQAQTDTFTDALPLISDISVNFAGGFDDSFHTNTGMTTINGPLKVINKLTAKRLAVKSNPDECAGAEQCDDGNACTIDSCNTDTGTCVHTSNSSACDDGNACTSDTCSPTLGCQYVPISLLCDDGNACTSDVCSPTMGCQYFTVANGTSCGSGLLCQNGSCLQP